MIDLTTWDTQMRAQWEPLRDQAAYAAFRGEEHVGLHDDVPFEVGSAFKAFVAAEYARQVAAGQLDPAMQLTIQPVDRVDSSLVTEAIPDGADIALQDAAEAMIGASDNTATDLVLRAVGSDRVRALLAELSIDATMPDSTKSLYERVAAEPDWRPVCCRVTMRDLARFYTVTVADDVLGGATGRFLALLREEDIAQGAAWPTGTTCYRKSGSIEPPPLFALGMGGAFRDADGSLSAFAFTLNVPFPEDAAYEGSPLEPLVHTFSEGLRRGLDALAEAPA